MKMNYDLAVRVRVSMVNKNKLYHYTSQRKKYLYIRTFLYSPDSFEI